MATGSREGMAHGHREVERGWRTAIVGGQIPQGARGMANRVGREGWGGVEKGDEGAHSPRLAHRVLVGRVIRRKRPQRACGVCGEVVSGGSALTVNLGDEERQAAGEADGVLIGGAVRGERPQRAHDGARAVHRCGAGLGG